VYVAILLVDFGPIGQHDVDAPWTDVSEARAKMQHQALALKTGLDTRLDPEVCRFWLPLAFHWSPSSMGLLFFPSRLSDEVGV
jgi:hypothetical protein